MKRSNLKYLSGALLMAFLMLSLNACGPSKGENPGHEYMPDMYHSIAYESNYQDYYYFNTWGSEEDYYKIAKPRKPVNGTIARGYAGVAEGNIKPGAVQAKMKMMKGKTDVRAISVPVNGSVPYYYEDTEDERLRATAEIIDNPYPITQDGLERGKELYEIFCGICHGNKGAGNGYLVAEENKNAAYPAQPISFVTDELIAASNGRYYHAIMYGKNVMGAYKDKMSYEERWQVIHYIRALQAKEKGLAYSEEENTLNEVEVPGALIAKVEEPMEEEMHEGEETHDGETHGEDSHGEDKHSDEHHGDDHSEGGHGGGNH